MGANASAEADGGTGDESDSLPKLLGKCLLVGGALGVVGFGVFLGLVMAGITWTPLGLIPPVAAGYGVRRLAGERGGVLTALVALVTGMGPLALLYLVLAGIVGWGIGRGDVIILLFGPYLALKLGTGTDGGETLEDRTDGEDVDLEEIDEQTAAELLTVDDPEAALAAELEGDGGADGGAAARDGGGTDEGTASDFVETGFDEDDF